MSNTLASGMAGSGVGGSVMDTLAPMPWYEKIITGLTTLTQTAIPLSEAYLKIKSADKPIPMKYDLGQSYTTAPISQIDVSPIPVDRKTVMAAERGTYPPKVSPAVSINTLILIGAGLITLWIIRKL